MHPSERPNDNLDDLRAKLPAEFRDAPVSDVPALWMAVNAAARGASPEAIGNLTSLPAETIRRVIASLDA